jgi:ribosomal protein S18 acetylase RimI-like enzyme
VQGEPGVRDVHQRAGRDWEVRVTTTVRQGRPGDAAALKALDTVMPLDSRRAVSIDEWFERDIVFVAEVDGTVVGYAVFNHDFFDYGNVDMLMLHRDFRGQRIGEQLLQALQGVCDTPKLFCTTNVSNHRMQRLLSRCGFLACGFIDELDPGDPELVYVKRLASET